MLVIGYISICTVFTFLLYFIVSLFINNKATVKYCTVVCVSLTIAFTVIAFMTFPNEGTDLKRYYQMLSSMDNYNLSELFTDWYYSTTPLTVILFLFVKYTNVFNLLPAVATLIIMIIHTYILRKETALFKPRTLELSMFFLTWFGISFIRSILTGVRQHLALAFFALVVHRLFIEKKHDFKTLLFIIIPLLIHAGTLPFAIILLIFYISKNVNSFATFFVLLFVWIGLNVDIPIPYFEYVKDRLDTYSEIEYPDIRYFIVRICFLVALFIGWYLTRKEFAEIGFKRYSDFFLTTFVFTVFCFSNQMLFDRMFTGLATFSFPLIAVLFKGTRGIRRDRALLFLSMLFMICGIFAYQWVDMNVSWRLFDVIVKDGTFV